MSTDKITVELTKREVIKKGLAGLRANGQVPAVVHNHGKESIHAMGELTAMLKMYSAAGKHHPVEVKLDGKSHLALVKDVDFEPTKHRMRHVVFQAIRQNEETEAEIPVVFADDVEIPAEKKSLLVLKQLDTVQVKALPRDLPDQIVVDPSSLADAGDHLTVADLQVPKGVTILTPEDTSVASVEVPKDQIAEANAAQESLAADAGASTQPADSSEETAGSADTAS